MISAAALLAYGGALRGSFHFDDYSLLNSPLIGNTSGLWQMWGISETRPLTNLTFWLNYHCNGAQPFGYHAVNLLLHIAAALLLYLALCRMMAAGSAFWAALLFAVHPAQSEAVAYIFARSTLLSAVFCLGALYVWLHNRRNAAIFLFFCALLCKEECVTFPLVLLLFEMWRKQKLASYVRPIGIMLTLALLAGIRAAWATAQLANSGAGFTAGLSPMQYLLTQGSALLRYFRLLIIPWGFTIEPSVNLATTLSYLFAWAAFLLGTCAAVWFYRQQRPWAFWIVCGFVLLLPSSSIFPATDLAADRRMYLPMIAFSAAWGLLTLALWKQVPLAVVTLFTALSILRMEAWRTERNLWREAVMRSPSHARPLIQLSRTVSNSEAAELLAEAKSRHPKNADIAAELGSIWLKSGQYAFALQEFGRALALRPNDANALNNRGAALLALKQDHAARLDFERALRISPCLAAARQNLSSLNGPLPPCASMVK